MNAVDLHHGSASDVGRVRTVNEDAFLVAPPVFVVADGMGGHAGGDVASALVVEEFGALCEGTYDARRGAEAVVATLARCQARIREYAESQRRDGGPAVHAGTTVVVALLVSDDEGPRWLLANLGDSRIYRLLDDHLDQVSVDHSVVQELMDTGRLTPQEAADHPERHVITRALSGQDVPEPDFFLVPLPAAERLLLCSDGVSGMLEDGEIEEVLRACHDPRDAAERLVRAAVAAGGRDNATAVVVDVVGLVKDDSYDSERQRLSLETKLGALP